MYGWIWRHLPGPKPVRALEMTVLVLGIVAFLLFVVFPWVDPLLPFNHVTTGG